MTVGRQQRGDGGSGTIYALVVLAVLAAIALAASAVGGAVVARHRAMAAADLAALAAADALARSEPDRARRAVRIASRHAVDLVGCTTTGLVVDVVVGARLSRRPRLRPGGADARRAGPADRRWLVA